jgi:hypothetical protein
LPNASIVKKKTSSKCGTRPVKGRRSNAAMNRSRGVISANPLSAHFSL